jgi:hypothetical protein
MDELERRAAKAMLVGHLVSGEYLSKFIAALLGAAGTATAQVLIENWGSIWSKIHVLFSFRPALVGPRRSGSGKKFLVLLNWEDRFADASLQPIKADQVVRWFVNLRPMRGPQARRRGGIA